VIFNDQNLCVLIYIKCIKSESYKALHSIRIQDVAGHLWLIMPIILATWETEIRRIEVRGKPRELVCKILSPKQPEQNGLGMCVAQVVECLLFGVKL
jgi:hypothetical protein